MANACNTVFRPCKRPPDELVVSLPDLESTTAV